jgi:hypothetical protein
MSHHRERTEKNCLNCGTEVQGRYCHVCGQENIEPKESFWHLVKHFFNDITHFDGKFFHSLKYVLFRPGALPAEYAKGRRASFLNPVRMYVFTSFVFFLIFFSLSGDWKNVKYSIADINGKTLTQIDAMDSTEFAAFTATINSIGGDPGPAMTRKDFRHYVDSLTAGGLHFTGYRYRSKAEYDSMLAHGAKKHNWIQRTLIYKEIALNEKYENNSKNILIAFRNKFLHLLPQMLFVSLPLLALLLKLLYIRRKEFYYVNHAIFSIYLYIFLFLVFLVMIGIGKLSGILHWGIFDYTLLLLGLGIFVYEYAAMYKFYRQGVVKTFFKFLLLNMLYIITLLVLFFGFMLFSLFEI